MARPTDPAGAGHRSLRLITGLGLSLLLGASAWAGPQPNATSMDLVVASLEQAVDAAFSQVQLPASTSDMPVLVRPQTQNAANWLVDHIVADRLLARGYPVTLDSAVVGPGAPQLTYRILDLRLGAHSGLLRSGIKRQSKASVAFSLSRADTLCWQGEFHGQQSDRIPKGRTDLLEVSTPGYTFAQTEVKEQSWGSFVEPVIVSTVLGGLIYLFFSSR